MSVGPRACASPRSPARLAAREAPAASRPRPGPARPRLSHSKNPKTSDDFAPFWQVGLECFLGGGLRQQSGGPCPLRTPLRSFLLLRFSSSVLYHTFPPYLRMLISGELLGPVVLGTACWPGEGVAVSTQNILSGELLRCSKQPPLQLALMGPGLRILIRQLGEVSDLLAAF